MAQTDQNKTEGVAGLIWRWLGSDIVAPGKQVLDKKEVDWPRVIPFIGMHVACAAVVWVGWSWTAVAVAVAAYLVRMFAITGFYHRYFSHRAFKTSRFMQFVFAVMGSSAVQRGPLWWASHHRHHHRHSDGPLDVHSPHQHGVIWSHMGWFTARSAYVANLEAVPDLAKYPELRFIDRFDTLVPVLYAGLLIAVGALLGEFVPSLGVTGPQLLVWGFFISTIALYHGTYTINSLSHLIGSRRFSTGDSSRNNFVLALITLGEGWHNNHHYYPGAVRQGFYWWELDITYYILCVLNKVGLVWDLNPVPERVYEKAAAEAAKRG